MRSPFLAFVVLAATMAPSLTSAAPACTDTLERAGHAVEVPQSAALPIRYLIGLTKREPEARLTRLTGIRPSAGSASGGSGNAESGDSGDVSGGSIAIDGEGGNIRNTDSSMSSLFPPPFIY